MMMMINYLKTNKFSAILTLLCVLNLSLFTNVAQAQAINKSLKSKLKVSSLKAQENLALDLHLTLSRSIAPETPSTEFELQNSLALWEMKQTIPLRNQTLIANSFSGRASWYGPGFHGRLTANGERYNQNALTAAHPNLKFGTRVKVTNLRNGRSVIVRINDRGPYVKGRVIDVSAAAARTLGMIRSGVAPVKVTILGK